MQSWQLQEAKARLSELVKLAASDGPQHITVHGEPAVVILSEQEYRQLIKPKSSFLEFLNNSPLKGAVLDIKRDKSTTRNIDL